MGFTPRAVGVCVDLYVLKTPSLRNITLTRPDFHSGEVWSLEQAGAIMGESPPGQDLTDQEVDRRVAFLESLTRDQPEVILSNVPPTADRTPQPQFDDD